MNKFRVITTISGVLLLALVLVFSAGYFSTEPVVDNFPDFPEENEAVTNEGRAEHFFRLTRDPKTNSIPQNIRAKELTFASALDEENRFKSFNKVDNITWTEIGPNDVGGRTRGFAIDRRNSNILLAGGASGGMWKSTDGGNSWTIKTDADDHVGVTDIVQHPTNQDTWYYSTGEFDGSLSDRAFTAFYTGSGIHVSTDNGESWAQVETTRDDDVSFNSQFDFITDIEISSSSSSIFFSSNGIGIYKSANNLASSSISLGGFGEHRYATVQIASNGNLVAVLGSPFSEGDPTTNSPGVYISTNDGVSWSDVTPAAFPDFHNRSVIGISESSPNIFYILTDTGGGADGLTLFRFDISSFPTVSSSERTSGIPNFGDPVGDLNPQGSYNMVCAVHPTNSETVFLGATNLFRSTDGFSTVPDLNNEDKYWIGGYDFLNNISVYDNHHPDLHGMVFDPNNANRAFSTHDGGISVTTNVLSEPVSWETKEEGYNVTQFYTVALHPDANDTRMLGGTQDNGSPFFNFNLTGNPSQSFDITSGDGSYSYMGNTIALASSQRGTLIRYFYDFNGDVTQFSYVAPLNAANQLFIHPFAVNPSNQDVLFYPSGNHFWRNTSVSTLTRNTDEPDGTAEGWTQLLNVNTGAQNGNVSTLAFSTSNPSNVLYYAGFRSDAAPGVFRLDNTLGTDGEVDISIPGTSEGEHIHGMAVNPNDGNEVIAVVSNYNVESVYHSSNAGATWTAIGGNLEDANGPSVRTAAIGLDGDGNQVYMVGTSVGLYATSDLNGASTTWTKQAEDLVGNTIVEYLNYRPSDGTVAVGTHGRGIFIGKIPQMVANEVPGTDNPIEFNLSQNYPNPFNPSTNISFSLPSSSTVSLDVFDVNGRKVASILNNQQMQAGSHVELFDGINLASGVYIYQLQATPMSGGQAFTQTRQMTLLK